MYLQLVPFLHCPVKADIPDIIILIFFYKDYNSIQNIYFQILELYSNNQQNKIKLHTKNWYLSSVSLLLQTNNKQAIMETKLVY